MSTPKRRRRMPEMPKRSIRADEQTWDRARRLARNATATGVSVSEWIRGAINAAWEDRRRPAKHTTQESEG